MNTAATGAKPLAHRVSLTDLNKTLESLPHDQWLAWTLIHCDGFDAETAAGIEDISVEELRARTDAGDRALRSLLGDAYDVKRIAAAHATWVRNLA